MLEVGTSAGPAEDLRSDMEGEVPVPALRVTEQPNLRGFCAAAAPGRRGSNPAAITVDAFGASARRGTAGGPETAAQGPGGRTGDHRQGRRALPEPGGSCCLPRNGTCVISEASEATGRHGSGWDRSGGDVPVTADQAFGRNIVAVAVGLLPIALTALTLTV
jgi:hypothetical protein